MKLDYNLCRLASKAPSLLYSIAESDDLNTISGLSTADMMILKQHTPWHTPMFHCSLTLDGPPRKLGEQIPSESNRVRVPLLAFARRSASQARQTKPVFQYLLSLYVHADSVRCCADRLNCSKNKIPTYLLLIASNSLMDISFLVFAWIARLMQNFSTGIEL